MWLGLHMSKSTWASELPFTNVFKVDVIESNIAIISTHVFEWYVDTCHKQKLLLRA